MCGLTAGLDFDTRHQGELDTGSNVQYLETKDNTKSRHVIVNLRLIYINGVTAVVWLVSC